MSGMVLHTELLFDHPGDHRRGPHSAIQSVGHRTTVENVSELFSLPLRQHRRPTGPVALEQTLDPMSLIARQPLADTSSDAIAAREESWLHLHEEYATFTGMMSFYLCAPVYLVENIDTC